MGPLEAPLGWGAARLAQSGGPPRVAGRTSYTLHPLGLGLGGWGGLGERHYYYPLTFE